MALIEPLDTGNWEDSCNLTDGHQPQACHYPYPVNCSVWDLQQGTFDHFSHVLLWAPEFGGRNGFPPPEKNELVLSIKMGCADTVPFQSKPSTPF